MMQKKKLNDTLNCFTRRRELALETLSCSKKSLKKCVQNHANRIIKINFLEKIKTLTNKISKLNGNSKSVAFGIK
jgi:hypothetical protein